MKCPVCVEEGIKSTVSIGFSVSTLGYSPAYYDDDGVYHDHNPNPTKRNFTCSNEHRFTVITPSKCPNCDYGKGSDKVIVTQRVSPKSRVSPKPVVCITDAPDAKDGEGLMFQDGQWFPTKFPVS